MKGRNHMNPDILRTLSYGMFAIGVQGEQRPTACIVNTVIQVTAEPMVVAVSVNHDNYTNECIKRTGEFAVSVLSENTSGTVIGALGFSSGRNADKLANVNYKVLREGEPVLREDICCWFLCKVLDSIETLTHTIFLAEVTAGSDEYKGTPMTYDYYHKVIKGKAPKNAPTYRREEASQDTSPEERYICTICGYVYDDPQHPFEELPDDWVCPICGAPKNMFKIKG